MIKLSGIFERRFWAALAAEARAEGLPACVVLGLPKTVEVMRARGLDTAPPVATELLPAWRRLMELEAR